MTVFPLSRTLQTDLLIDPFAPGCTKFAPMLKYWFYIWWNRNRNPKVYMRKCVWRISVCKQTQFHKWSMAKLKQIYAFYWWIYLFFLTLKLDFKYQPIYIFFYRHQRDRKWTYELWKNLKICYLVYNLEYQGGFFFKLKQNKSRNKQNSFHFFIIHGMCKQLSLIFIPER